MQRRWDRHGNILTGAGFLAFAVCGSLGLKISAVTGLVMMLAASRINGKEDGSADGTGDSGGT